MFSIRFNILLGRKEADASMVVEVMIIKDHDKQDLDIS